MSLWRPANESVTALNITVTHPSVKPGMKATLASGRPVVEVASTHTAVRYGGTVASVTFAIQGNFSVADALILRD
jgi:hypothetical protein